MKTVLLLKNIGAIAMYCLFAVPIAGYFGGDLSPLVCIQCLVLGLSRIPEKKAFRFLLILPSFACIYLCRDSLAEWIALLPVYGYMLWQTFGVIPIPSLNRQREWLGKGWFVLGFAAAAALMLSQFRLLIPWGLLWFFSSAALMRTLRHDSGVYGQWRFQIWNLSALGIAPAAAFLLGTRAVTEAVKVPLVLLRDWVLVPVGMILLWLPLFLLELLIRSLYWQNPPEKEIGSELGLEMYYEELKGTFTITTGMKWAMIAIPVALVILLAVYLLRSIPKGHSAPELRNAYEAEQDSILPKPAPKAREKESTLVSKMRQQYRQYLSQCGKTGIQRKESDTSLDVERLSEPVLGREVRHVRTLYIRARYGGNASKSDLRELRRVVRQIKYNGKRT